ncbi:LysR substrate-binding domain-containing protein [Paraburkholderia lacunae]|uniref:HTH lysR-type domain-containing protein n=1 Tax=Paraburkholderia lacunae TaxID=2211104 RepID=A0A370N9M8_9BURK|nr:LysR substrate-binding domain-containing protein [Paraburkholderia lacunae]RDK02293.1 hypothetical protein DLM46_11865 [Paraburkholderia lacunae]
MDRLTSMTVFVKAAETGSFSAAAAALGLSSQMVGKHIRFLEARYGMRLIDRTTRRQSLTEAGGAFYERSKAVLAEADAAEALAANLQAAPRGKLKVNAPVSFGAHSLTPALARYLKQYPEVDIDLTLSDRIVDLVDEGRFSINNGQALRSAALAGLGIIQQPREMLDEDLASGQLVRVLPGYESPSRPMHILFSPDRKSTPKLRSFIDFVVATFG